MWHCCIEIFKSFHHIVTMNNAFLLLLDFRKKKVLKCVAFESLQQLNLTSCKLFCAKMDGYVVCTAICTMQSLAGV